eukprot:c13290_g1_i1.p1 GENE.c13290_g1_i1~~c13290_g1_i1.p1  ORF type:complete len:348 (-),score=81.64 c13290_g1_i1:214-1257(-)
MGYTKHQSNAYQLPPLFALRSNSYFVLKLKHHINVLKMGASSTSTSETPTTTTSRAYYVNVVFTVLVSLLMLTMRSPTTKDRIKQFSQNPALWLHVIHWIKTVGMSVRLIIWSNADPRLVTLCFNCLGSLLVTLSAVAPIQLFVHHKVKHQYTRHMNHSRRLVHCAVVTAMYMAALAASLSVALTQSGTGHDQDDLSLILFVWRMWFFINFSIEVFFLSACVWMLSQRNKKATGKEQSQGRGSKAVLRANMIVTLYMRLGVGISIALKFTNKFDRGDMEAVHLWFMFTGMLGFHMLRGSIGWSSAMVYWRKTKSSASGVHSHVSSLRLSHRRKPVTQLSTIPTSEEP